jgi:hypothetical protein
MAKPVAAFYLLPTRAWELLVGAVVVFALPRLEARPVSPLWRELGSALGLLMLVAAIIGFDKDTPFPGLFALVPTVGTALILAFAQPSTSVGRLLCSPPLVKVGLISYSAYLWHQPLLALVRHEAIREPSAWILGGALMVSIALAYLSWRYVETPFRRPGVVSRRQIFWFSALGLVFFGAVGWVGAANRGFADRLPPALSDADADMPRSDNGWCFYSVDSNARLAVGAAGTRCWVGQAEAPVKALLFGDSFAGQYEPFWDRVGRQSGVAVHSLTTNWCFPSLGGGFIGPTTSVAYEQCRYNRAMVEREVARYDFVVLAGHWAKVRNADEMRATLELVDWLNSRGKFVVVMPSPRLYDGNIAAYFRKAYLRGSTFDAAAVGVERDQAARTAFEELKSRLADRDRVLLIEREDLFTVNGQLSDVMPSGVPFSLDGSHISIAGSKAAAESFLKSEGYRRLEKMLAGAAAAR